VHKEKYYKILHGDNTNQWVAAYDE
jgi:hypothetical protein